jgi:glucosamine kinase
VRERLLFLGVDGGGTRCRARLADSKGAILGEGIAGPANVRISLEESVRSVCDAAAQCLAQAGASFLDPLAACLALAGASEPREAAAAQSAFEERFRRALVTTDAHAACVGAHRGEDGGIVIVGTGSIGWAVLHGEQHRVGGWGLPVSDEGSGAWIGREVLRQVFCAFDGRMSWTPLLRRVFERYDGNPHAIVHWAAQASPREFATLAPVVVDHASRNDDAALEILRRAAAHIDAIATRLIALGVPRLSLMGGLASHVEPLLPLTTRQHLVEPLGDPLDGALLLARAAAEPVAA